MPTKTTAAAVPAQHVPTYTATDPARWRRRARTERIAYAAAAPLLAVGPTLDAALPLHAAVAATGAGSLMWLYYRARPPRPDTGGMLGGRPRRRATERLELETSNRLELLRAAYKATPVVTGAGLYLAALVAAPDLAPWWQWGGPAAWAAVMAAAVPRTRAPRRARRDPREMLADLERAAGMRPTTEEDEDQEAELPAPRTYEELVAWHWETAAVAPGCHLAHVRQIADGRPDFRAVVIAPHGKTVPQLAPAALAAVWDLPEGTVTLEPAPGHGPGHKLLTARPTLTTESEGTDVDLGGATREVDPDLAALYSARLAKPGGPLEGVQLLETLIEPNRIALRVRAQGDEVLRLPHKAIARALGIDDMELVVPYSNGMGDGIVSIYET
ncbi:hypothetical protein, partial [Streptomyces sp. SM14]|uniref:hypothetical protein n=1 Tax=Streptomyces sp. SM14 TaxID=1736045 RepID=UPI000CD4F171